MDVVDNQGNSHLTNVKVLEDFELLELESLVREHIIIIAETLGYTNDLRVELQNILLGNLFDNNLKKREPLSDEIKVIITNDPKKLEELKNYFNTETNWAIDNLKIKDKLQKL